MDSHDINMMSTKQLKAKLKKLRLPTTGLKRDLIERLQSYYNKASNEEAKNEVEINDEVKAYETQTRVQQAKLEALEAEIRVLKREKELRELQGTGPSSSSSNDQSVIKEAIVEAVSATKIPEPPVFDGNPLKYTLWKIKLQAMMAHIRMGTGNKIMYLSKYLSGKALAVIEHLFLVDDDSTYDVALNLLDKRFGDPFLTSEAFRSKLENWPTIKPDDFEGLRSYSDFVKQCVTAKRHIRGLSILDDNRESQRILGCLPRWVVLKWREKIVEHREKYGDYPPFEDFSEFLEKQSITASEPVTAQLLSKEKAKKKPASTGHSNFMHQQSKSFQSAKKPDQTKDSAVLQQKANLTTNIKPVCKCHYCSTPGHSLERCFSFMKLPWNQRHEFIKSQQLCFGCLGTGHRSNTCQNRKTCSTCKKYHPTCLHNENSGSENTSPQAQSSSCSSENPTANTDTNSSTYFCDSNSCGVDANSNNLTSTIIPVWVSSKSNPENEILVYALLDSMSDVCFVLDQTCDQLNARCDQTTLRLGTMVARSTKIDCKKVFDLQIRAHDGSELISLPPSFSREFIPVDRSHIPTPNTVAKFSHLSHLAKKLLPPQSCDVGLLIGYNCPQAFIPRETIVGENTEPFAVRTDIGWGVLGYASDILMDGDSIGITNRVVTLPNTECVNIMPGVDKHNISFNCWRHKREEFSGQLLKALELDFVENNVDTSMSQEDMKFLAIMKTGTFQNPATSHYSMPLPFRNKPDSSDNRNLALNRLGILRRKFAKDPNYAVQYSKFIEAMIQNGEAERVLDNSPADVSWYIPHFGVLHPKKEKLRVVFDCSAKYQGKSLNDYLLQGPDLMNSLIGILLRFRLNNIAVSCDIEKMFYQFEVHEADRNFLRFLWFENDSHENVVDYRMTVHLFGATSSPACATYGLRMIANSHYNPQNHHSAMAKDFITSDFYVDDGITSFPNVDTASKVTEQARKLCSFGGVRLHKFLSNSIQLMNSIPASEQADSVKQVHLTHDNLPVERTLGIQWSVRDDNLQFSSTKKISVNHRGVLSTFAAIYDSIGFLSPFVLRAKRILQQMCWKKLPWEDTLPDQFKIPWKNWLLELQEIESLKIPRQYWPGVNLFFDLKTLELHHFSDASEKGYGQCSYFRMISNSGEVHCALVMGKARVAPKKIVTIARLELQAAVVSVKISQLIQSELKGHQIQNFYWTDSKIVLGYIQNEARRFHTFVANRIQVIRSHTEPNQWYHVPSNNNPADIASRECRVSELSQKWWRGPEFLYKPALNLENCASLLAASKIPDSDPEVKSTVNVLSTTRVNKADHPLYEKLHYFSRWEKLLKFVQIFVVKARTVCRPNEHMDLVEIKSQCEKQVVKMIQQCEFSKELELLNLSDFVALPKSSPLYKLDPFIDDEGIIRVGGRLKHSTLQFLEKHPMILPKGTHVTKLVIQYFHDKFAHQGRGITVNAIRSHGFWIPGISKAVSSFIHFCVTCRKERGTLQVQKMANLPTSRIENSPPFSVCGADCFGPFIVQENRKQLKKYGLIFTCFSSRAVHIEILDDLSTNAFINAFRCFISIRGNVHRLHSDQGTNLVGAYNEFQKSINEINSPETNQILSKFNCDFVFNPPTASHMGGNWERHIRTIRSILTNLLNKSPYSINTSELRTLFYEIMAIINSRPLSADNLYDPLGPMPITPNHLVTMKSDVIIPPSGLFTNADLYTRKRWKKIQLLANNFWSQWKRQYLINLQQRSKWLKKRSNIRVDSVVLIADDNEPRNVWKLGRVVQTYPSSDGCVRKVKILVGNPNASHKAKPAYLERPIHKLVVILD